MKRKKFASEIMNPQRLSPDLVSRVRHSVERRGYCIFGTDEMERLFFLAQGTHSARMRVLHEFAEACGVEMETTPHLKSARFVKPKSESARHLSSQTA